MSERNSDYCVKVNLALQVDRYNLDHMAFKFPDLAQAQKKKSEVEELLHRALIRETDTFQLGDCCFLSDNLYGYRVTIKEPKRTPDARAIPADEENDD